jgi:hypothetical protein
VVAVVVAVVVVVAILFAAGYLFHKSSSAPTTTEPYATLDEAEQVAGPAAGQSLGGSWSSAVAIGVHLAAQITLPLANFTGLVNVTNGCTIVPAPGAPTSTTVEATPSSALPGHDAFWLIGLTNGAGSLAFVSVAAGVATALYSVAGGSCATDIGLVSPFPSDEADSPALVGAVNASGGAAFLATYPNAAQFLLGAGGVTYDGFTLGPVWEALDTSCPLPLLINETGTSFNATVTGAPAVVEAHSSGPMNCAAGLGSVVGAGVSLTEEEPLPLAFAKSI